MPGYGTKNQGKTSSEIKVRKALAGQAASQGNPLRLRGLSSTIVSISNILQEWACLFYTLIQEHFVNEPDLCPLPMSIVWIGLRPIAGNASDWRVERD